MHLYVLNHKPGLLLICLNRPCSVVSSSYGFGSLNHKDQRHARRLRRGVHVTLFTVSYLKTQKLNDLKRLFSQTSRKRRHETYATKRRTLKNKIVSLFHFLKIHSLKKR